MKSFLTLTFSLVLSFALLLSCFLPFSSFGQELKPVSSSVSGEIVWFDALDLGLTGQAWDALAHPYDRLPAKAKGIVREPVWRLGTNTAGLSVHFQTDSKAIHARWTVRYNNSMWHMTDCGIRGLDLYMDDDGTWRYAGSGSPGPEKLSEREILDGMDGQMHDYHLNLPLYDGIDTLWIGVEKGSIIKGNSLLKGNPIVIYGTSIQQGGCATRPGMAASNILSRRLDREVINLGFSGNGRMEMELAGLISEIDASAFIFDCLPNIHDLDVISPRYIEFVVFIREKHPETPIYLVETATTVKSALVSEDLEQLNRQNEELIKAYKALKTAGIRKLFIIPGRDLIGTDQEGTVDGVHYTDLGFLRYADKVLSIVGKRLER